MIDVLIGLLHEIMTFHCGWLEIEIPIGNRSTSVEMNLPTSGCGIRSDMQSDGSMEMSVRLVIQMDEKLRQLTDMEKVVRCNLPNQMMEINIGMSEDRKIFR